MNGSGFNGLAEASKGMADGPWARLLQHLSDHQMRLNSRQNKGKNRAARSCKTE